MKSPASSLRMTGSICWIHFSVWVDYRDVLSLTTLGYVLYSSRLQLLLQHVVDIPQPVVRARRQDFADCIVQYFHFGLFLRSECGDDRAAQIRPAFELELIPVERTHKIIVSWCGILGRGLTSNRGSTEAGARCTARTKTVHNVPHRNSRRRCDFASTRCPRGRGWISR